MDLTPDQIAQLQSLGIDPTGVQKSISKPLPNTSNSTENISEEIKVAPTSPLSFGQIEHQTISSSQPIRVPKQPVNPIVPLLSISGLTLISFGGIVLFKNKESTVSTPNIPYTNPQSQAPNPTQVPKSIQHYLLTSQQLFTQALQAQSSCTGNPSGCPSAGSSSVPDLINQSILAATDAIKQFPDDYRGYDQRGRLYQSLADSNPTLLANAIADLSTASKLNPNSAEITRALATLFAKSGDVAHTLDYLSQTISLEPTNAQNFYDLARLQTQAGLVPQALDTYTRLLTLVADPTQKTQVENEKSSLEKLVAQSPKTTPYILNTNPQTPTIPPATDGPLLQADLGTGGLIIAAPETSKDISVKNQTDSNALAGTSTLPANTPSISLTNTQLAPTSQIYLAITKGGKNQTLQVLSRSKDSFVVGLDSAISEPIEFKWWIVN